MLLGGYKTDEIARDAPPGFTAPTHVQVIRRLRVPLRIVDCGDD
jgi:hypothetical protein